MKATKAREELAKIAKIPYPKLEGIKPDIAFANILYNDFAGENSEFSAISNYIFQQINIEGYPEINTIMRAIAIVEMHHLDVLGEMIKRSGLIPYYMSSNGRAFWNAGYVRYDTKDVIQTMECNIQDEQNEIAGYKYAIPFTNNRSIQETLNRIILDEQTHIEIFRQVIQDLKTGKQD